MNNSNIQASIAAKVAAYKAANTQAKKATFGLPTAQTGYTFATHEQEAFFNQSHSFETTPKHWGA